MKKHIFSLFFLCFCMVIISGQEVLPEYNGFWSKGPINIIDIIDYYPDRIDILRNEIYARYGRPFINQKYRQYFSSQDWYMEKSDFSETWLTDIDRWNIDFILAVENTPPCYEIISNARKNNIVYKVIGGDIGLHFALFSHNKAVEGGYFHGDYYINENSRQNWTVMGNWILIYEQLGPLELNRYNVSAYLLDSDRQIIRMALYNNLVYQNIMEKLIESQEKIKEKFTSEW